MKVLMINGSPRVNGNTSLALDEMTKIFEENGVNCVIYGHLHGKESRVDKKLCKNGIDYYLTSCDQIGFKLVEIEI